MIKICVQSHPSGRLTLTKQGPGDKMPVDCDGKLAHNMNAGEFYRATAAFLAGLHKDGADFTYQDAE